MSDIELIEKRAERNLNSAHADFKATSSTLAQDFREIKLHALMFQYELCREMGNLIRTKPEGFALSVALKGCIHKLYEYDRAVNSFLSKRFVALATARDIQVDLKPLSTERKKWRSELKKLAHWNTIRNRVTGHYDADLALQIALLEKVSLAEVMSVAEGFLNVNITFLKILRDAGKA